MAEPRRHLNKVTGYLKPKQDALFKGLKSASNMGDSEAINMIVKDFFARVPEDRRLEYLRASGPKQPSRGDY